MHLINEGTLSQQLLGLRELRKHTSKENNPPIQEVIDYNLVPTLVEYLESDNPDMVFEAAWVLLNVASGTSEQTKSVVDAGAVPKLIKLINLEKLNSQSMDIIENAIWALGNIAGDSPRCRDYVLSQGALRSLMEILNENGHKLSMMRNATWTLSNFCRGKNPQPDWSTVLCLI